MNPFTIEIPPRFVTCTLPARFLVDGLGGGDVALRELTTEEFVDTIDDPPERTSRAVLGCRGQELPQGAAREEWIRKLPKGVGALIGEAVRRFNALAPAEDKAFKDSHAVEVVDGIVRHRWMFPGSVVDADKPVELVMSELTFGKVDDIMAGAVAAKKPTATFDLAAAALGRDCAAWLRGLPARVGTAIIGAYAEIHRATPEEEGDFFDQAQVTRTRPKVL